MIPQQLIPIPRKLHPILHRVYGSPASVTKIKGRWKTGKTDFALLLSEILRQEKILSQVASNIDTKGSGEIEFINDFTRFDIWQFQNNQRKLFIYDEVIESAPGRRAMSGLNVGWVRRIPQLSKARCHLIIIIQTEDVADSVFSIQTFQRGTWIKLDKTVVVWRGLYAAKSLVINNIPRTRIVFDPYLPATFNLDNPSLNFTNLPRPLQVMTLYGDGKSFTQIQNELNIKHPTEVKRDLQKACHATALTLLQKTTEGMKLQEECKKEPI